MHLLWGEFDSVFSTNALVRSRRAKKDFSWETRHPALAETVEEDVEESLKLIKPSL